MKNEMKNDRVEFKIEFRKRLYQFVLDLINFVDCLPRETTSQVIGKQLIRSGTSICANYVEAQAASSKKDFTNYFHHSLKSANESEFWISLLRDSHKTNSGESQRLLDELNELSKILGASLITLKK